MDVCERMFQPFALTVELTVCCVLPSLMDPFLRRTSGANGPLVGKVVVVTRLNYATWRAKCVASVHSLRARMVVGLIAMQRSCQSRCV